MPVRPLLAALAATVAVVASTDGSAAPRQPLAQTFRQAAAAYRVPERLLVAVGYVNTRLRMPARPALDGGVGIMHLLPAQLRRASRLARSTPAEVRLDARKNVRAGAALLASMRPGRAGLSAWYGPLERLGGAVYADEIFATLRRGFAAEGIRVPPTAVSLPRHPAASTRADYPAALWHAASPANYERANRPVSGAINTIVIHATEGSYAGAVNWFANPRARVSSHYIVRSMDGQVTQAVREKDIAWHTGNRAYNAKSVGIEHEAFLSNCAWYTDAMYRASAQLAAYLAAKYLIPIDRQHIIGHSEVPDPNNPNLFGGANHHTDPGPCWNWSKYMSLVTSYAETRFATTTQRVVDDARRGAVRAPRGWVRASSVRSYARSYVVAKSSKNGAPARFSLQVPRAGSYALYAWWPAARSRSSSVPVGIDTSEGRKWVHVDERVGTGWRYLGTFPLSHGVTHVFVSRNTRAAGSIAADAFKVELVTRRWDSRLVSGGTGWVLSKAGLSRTLDAGQTWTTVLPPGVAVPAIRAATWSGQTALLLVATGRRAAPLALLRTSDAGTTWSSVDLPVPADADVAASATLQELDATHLVVGLRLEPNQRSLSRGLVLRSSDGGTTWRTRALPEGGDVSFSTLTDGWLVAGFARELLYSTHNGGKTWSKLTPAGSGGVGTTAYDAPAFSSPSSGVLPLSVAAGNRSAVGFATTKNTGRSWKLASSFLLGSALGLGQTVPSAVGDPATWYAAVRGKLVAVTEAGAKRKTIGPLPGAVSSLQFTSPLDGWARVGTCRPASCSVRLFSTGDGGVTWTAVKRP